MRLAERAAPTSQPGIAVERQAATHGDSVPAATRRFRGAFGAFAGEPGAGAGVSGGREAAVRKCWFLRFRSQTTRHAPDACEDVMTVFASSRLGSSNPRPGRGHCGLRRATALGAALLLVAGSALAQPASGSARDVQIT